MRGSPAAPHAPERAAPPTTLVALFGPSDLELLSDAELSRFVPGRAPVEVRATGEELWPELQGTLAWELLYRKHPDLYLRLTVGEQLHPGCIEALGTPARVVEVGAGWGRLTFDLAFRSDQVVAIEPARPLRDLLADGLSRRGLRNVEVVDGFFDSLPVSDGWADLCVAASAFTPEEGHGGEVGLREMMRVVRTGGRVAVIWPGDPSWLVERGFTLESFDSQMHVEFPSNQEAIEIARVFYPDVVGWLERSGERRIPYEKLGVGAPRTICWRTVG